MCAPQETDAAAVAKGVAAAEARREIAYGSEVPESLGVGTVKTGLTD